MKTLVKKLFTVIILTVITLNAYSTVYTTVSDGNWNSQNIWSPSKPVMNWSFDDTVLINNNITLSSNLSVYGRMEIAQGASLTSNNHSLYIKGGAHFINNGTLGVKIFKDDWSNASIENNGSMSVANNFYLYDGNFTNNGTMSVTGSLTVSYSGNFTNAQNAQLTINNSLVNKNVFVNDGSISVAKDLKNYWSSSFTNSGTVQVTKEVKNQGTITNSGSFSSSKKWTNDWGTTLNNSGNITVNYYFTNKGSVTNQGTISVSLTFVNKMTITNTNTINALTDMYNTYGTVNNTGVINITNNLINNGSMTNDGGMFVDGYVNSNGGNIGGTGNLCNSDGITDPTGGSKSVTCPICTGEGGSLPVNLLTFKAVVNGKVVMLSWSTASEVNNDYFEVLRSNDGINYESVARLTGAGNSNVQLDYNAVDEFPAEGTNYYILKQVDYDGSVSLSKPVQVEVSNETVFSASVYPNPLSSGDALTIETGDNSIKTVEVFDVEGRLVKSVSDMASKISINTSMLTEGIYIVRIIRDTNIISKKIRVR